MTPVPIQPMRVFLGSALVSVMFSSQAFVMGMLSYSPSRHEIDKRIPRRGLIPGVRSTSPLGLAATYNYTMDAKVIPKLRAPIVLVHGFLGFDRLQVGGATLLNYFQGIPELLQAAGNRVLIPALVPTGGVEERATQLKAFIQSQAAGEPVHILAHSMG